MLKKLRATKDMLKTRTMTTKRKESCQGTKQKFENKLNDKHKKMRSSRQNDKLEQRVMHREFKVKVQGSILGSKKIKVFFHV